MIEPHDYHDTIVLKKVAELFIKRIREIRLKYRYGMTAIQSQVEDSFRDGRFIDAYNYLNAMLSTTEMVEMGPIMVELAQVCKEVYKPLPAVSFMDELKTL